MQNLNSKIVAIAISILMIVSIGAAISQLPDASAAISIPTLSYINVAPNPVGLGQSVTVDFWLAVPTQTSELAQNMTVHVTLPDGTTATLGPFTSDITGGTTTIYTPTETGNYSFYMTYGGQYLTLGAYNGDYSEPSTSNTVSLTVQSSPVTTYPFTPLPTQYWQTPVSAENVQNWASIVGPWLGLASNPFGVTGAYNQTGNYNPFTTGPTTGHILWTQPWCVGGVAGGEAGNTETSDYWTTSQYEPKWNPVVIDGIEYSTWYTTTTGYNQGIVATNLYNGQTMYIINTTNALKFGMQFQWETPNQYGVDGPFIVTTGSLPPSDTGGTPYITIGTQFNVYDALTGRYVCSVVNGSAPSFYTTDASGNIIGYLVNSTAGTQLVHAEPGLNYITTQIAGENAAIEAWNFTMALGQNSGQFSLGFNQQHLWSLGLMYRNPVVPNNITGVPIAPTDPALNFGGLTGGQVASGVIVAITGAGDNGLSVGETTGFQIEAGFSAATGNMLWGPYNRTETPYTRLAQNFYNQAGDGVYVDVNEATFVCVGYSLYSGAQLWTTTLTGLNGASPNTYDEYGIQNLVNPTQPIIYLWGLGGDVWALNMTNGNVIWYSNTNILTGSSGTETPYGIWPLWVQYGGCEAGVNQVLYLSEGHEYSPPLFHGAQLVAVNATTGQYIWSELNYDDTAGEVSYGIMTAYNSYDGSIYAWGQGPSATTVTAPNVGVTTATPVVIAGTVMDVSAGASQEAVKANFPNGLPCVSDASMSAWMEYVYMQQPHPSNITGVTVSLTSIDPNGNTVPIGTATTDASGMFHYTWTPPITGTYTVIATFQGTGGYYGSYAETAVYAGSPAATPAPTASPVSLASTQNYVLGIGIAIIVIIIVIGAVLALLLLRKKP